MSMFAGPSVAGQRAESRTVAEHPRPEYSPSLKMVTGMPALGKSALVADASRLCAAEQFPRSHSFT